ncbi:mpv17 2 [Paramuricea clavata]|uniref:Mpv17 2 n=2 Tax=Paramuricea clavata TaxID=317549 RepID=A0A7D9EC09_PARCT|nr:mpv17 2 [Paramuricea clavata]
MTKINVDPTINKTLLIASVSIFNEGMAKLDGHSFERCWNEIKLKFWPVYKMDLSVWPAAQAVNFYVVPGQYRVAYVSFVALLWNIFLSYISHKKEDEF